MRLLECSWLQQQHKSSVEACIRTLAMVGKELCRRDALLPACQRDAAALAASAPAAGKSHHPYCSHGRVPLGRLSAGSREVWLWDVPFELGVMCPVWPEES